MSRPAVLKIDILADGKQADREMSRTGRATEKLGKLGKVAAAGLAVGAAAVVGLGVAAVKSASDVQQAVGGAQSVFQEFSDSVIKNSEAAAMQLGLSKSGYLDLANIIGSQLKNAGVPMDQLAGKTQELVTKGADLAATFGGTTQDAVNALSSALKGEMDPIERYGVAIKKSDVNARLAEQGLDKLEGAARRTAEQQALLALINEQTADSVGQFGRESDTAAGVAQRAGAVWENIKATLGEGLLPILATLGNYFLEKIVPSVQTAAASFSANLGPTITRVSGFISGTVVPAIQTLWSWFTTKLAPGISRGVTPVISAARDAFGRVKTAIDQNKPAIDKVVNAARVLAEWFANKVVPVAGKVISIFVKLQGGAISTLIRGLGLLVNGISSAVRWFQSLIDKIQAVVDKIRNSGVGKLVSGIAGAVFGSQGRPGAAVASRLVGGGLVAAGGGGSIGTLLPSISVAAPQVTVFLGEREITDVVRVELRQAERARARRALVKGS